MDGKSTNKTDGKSTDKTDGKGTSRKDGKRTKSPGTASAHLLARAVSLDTVVGVLAKWKRRACEDARQKTSTKT